MLSDAVREKRYTDKMTDWVHGAEDRLQYLLENERVYANPDNSIRIAASDNKAREAIAQYMARCRVSLNKIIYEPFKGKVIFKKKYNKYFKENLKVYDADEFIARLAQHIPLPRMRILLNRQTRAMIYRRRKVRPRGQGLLRRFMKLTL